MATPIKRWFLNNTTLKLLSLLLTVLLWFYIAGEQTEDLKVKIPLQIEPPQDMAVVGRMDDTLDVVLRGPRNVIRMLSSSELQAYHKIEELEAPGEHIFTITLDDISRLPREVRVVRIKPHQVIVKLDRLVRKRLPIKANIEGMPAEGFEVLVDKISLSPTTASIAGSESVLEELSYIQTLPIDVGGRARTFVEKIGLGPITGQRLKEKILIEATVPIQKVFTERTYKGVEVKVLGAASRDLLVEVGPSKVDLVLSGPELSLKRLRASKILAFVDVTKLRKGTHELPLKVILPEAITLVGERPTVEVSLTTTRP